MNGTILRKGIGVVSVFMLCLNILCLFSITGAAQTDVNDLPAIDVARRGSLTLDYAIDGQPCKTTASIYRIASVNEAAGSTLAGAFTAYPVLVGDLRTHDEWVTAAETLAAYAVADNIAPEMTATADDDGFARFADLQTGLYLVVTDVFREGGFTAVFSPFILSIPSLNDKNEWDYDVFSIPKGTVMTSGRRDVEYRVVKHWANDGDGTARPAQVEVQILQDGKVIYTQILSAENNWTFAWKGKEDTLWQLVERNVDDNYTVTVEQDNRTFYLTNTYAPPPPPPPPTATTTTATPPTGTTIAPPPPTTTVPTTTTTTKRPTPTTPYTGDSTDPTLPIIGIALSALGLAVSLLLSPRERKQDEA